MKFEMTDTKQYLLCCIQQDPSKDSKTKSRKPSINDRWRTQQDLRRRTMSDRTGLEGFVKRFKSYRLNENRSDLSPISILKIVWIDNQVRAVIITWLNQWGLAGHWRTIVGICYQLLDDDHNGNVLLWAFEVILMNFLAQLSIVSVFRVSAFAWRLWRTLDNQEAQLNGSSLANWIKCFDKQVQTKCEISKLLDFNRSLL